MFSDGCALLCPLIVNVPPATRLRPAVESQVVPPTVWMVTVPDVDRLIAFGLFVHPALKVPRVLTVE